MDDEETHIVLVKRNKPRPSIYLRAMPSTAKHPTPGQIIQRVRFSRAARMAKGSKKVGNTLPGMLTVKRYASGKTGYARTKPKKWQLILIDLVNEKVKTKELSKEEANKIIEEVLS